MPPDALPHGLTFEPWTVSDVRDRGIWPVEMAAPEILLPERFGLGRVTSVVMRAGFQCCLFQGELTRAGTLSASDPSPVEERVALACAVVLEGGTGLTPDGLTRPAALNAGDFVVHHSVEPRMALQLQPSRLLFFNAGFSVNLLRELVSDLHLPPPLRQIVERGEADPFALPGRLDAYTRRLMEEIRFSPYSEAATRLHHQAKALELLAHLVELWSERRTPQRKRWTRRDINRLEEARVLLLRDLEQPPGLGALAATVGLSPTKLKLGFRDLFESTVSDTLREARLHAAKLMLQQGDLPLKTIAHRVGFSDAANLSRAFKAKFGVAPGLARRK